MYKRLLAFVSLVLSLTAVESRAVNVGTSELTVNVVTPDVVREASDFLVNTTVTNTGAQAVTLLKHSGVFWPLSENFAIADSSGNVAKFNGIKFKWSPEIAAKNNGTTVVLAPGETVTIGHDLTQAYDFSGLERGATATVQLAKGAPIFYAIDQATGGVTATAAAVVHERPELKIAEDAVLPVAQAPKVARAPQAGCTAAEVATITATVPLTVGYVTASRNYLQNQGAGAIYTRWFGVSTASRFNTVSSVFTNLVGNNFAGFTYNCHASAPGCQAGTYAYVSPSTYGVVYLCDEFFNSPATGYDSRASTLVHEASHFNVNGGTDDIEYGVNECLNLAITDPDDAIDNASNYEYFSVDA